VSQARRPGRVSLVVAEPPRTPPRLPVPERSRRSLQPGHPCCGQRGVGGHRPGATLGTLRDRGTLWHGSRLPPAGSLGALYRRAGTDPRGLPMVPSLAAVPGLPAELAASELPPETEHHRFSLPRGTRWERLIWARCSSSGVDWDGGLLGIPLCARDELPLAEAGGVLRVMDVESIG